MIALEMAAPDPFDTDPAETQSTAPPPADSGITVRQPEPAAAQARKSSPPPSVQPSPQHSLQVSLERSPQPSPEPVSEPSLGSTLIASGILAKPKIIGPDPLAPIRRMSQAEKVAFFS